MNDPRSNEWTHPEGNEDHSRTWEGHWPPHSVEKMGSRNVLTVALDLVGGVRGANDLCLSDCANSLTVLEWYIENWKPSECPFDSAVLECIKAAKSLGDDWFRSQASDIGL